MRLEFENEKNKVADMEKHLDVSTDTIRYHEKYGLILPKKDRNSNSAILIYGISIFYWTVNAIKQLNFEVWVPYNQN